LRLSVRFEAQRLHTPDRAAHCFAAQRVSTEGTLVPREHSWGLLAATSRPDCFCNVLRRLFAALPFTTRFRNVSPPDYCSRWGTLPPTVLRRFTPILATPTKIRTTARSTQFCNRASPRAARRPTQTRSCRFGVASARRFCAIHFRDQSIRQVSRNTLLGGCRLS